MSKGFFGWCRRYLSPMFLGIGALYVIVLFFNDNSYQNLRSLKAQERDLKKEIATERDSLDRYRQLNQLLESQPAEMERIARERFFMQRPGEEVYVFD